MTAAGSAGSGRVTARLRLRPPTGRDLAAYVQLHTDARTGTRVPGTAPTPARCAEELGADLAHWQRHGFGNHAVEDRTTGEVVGWAGPTLRVDGSVDLRCRLAHDRRGRGLGRELVRAAAETCLESVPTRRVRVQIEAGDAASLTAARVAGLQPVGTAPDRRGGDADLLVLELPRIRALRSVTDFDDAVREDVVDLWTRVNDAGGAVGFRPGAARADIGEALREQEESIRTGHAVAGLLHSPDGVLLGLGFWQRDTWWGHSHLLTLRRLMVDPDHRGAGTGRRLMSGLHGLARTVSGIELWSLSYRSGLGVGDFYGGLGWSEVGRQPSAIRLGPDDHRDRVLMMRDPRGLPLRVDGRR